MYTNTYSCNGQVYPAKVYAQWANLLLLCHRDYAFHPKQPPESTRWDGPALPAFLVGVSETHLPTILFVSQSDDQLVPVIDHCRKHCPKRHPVIVFQGGTMRPDNPVFLGMRFMPDGSINEKLHYETILQGRPENWANYWRRAAEYDYTKPSKRRFLKF